jgi:MOSC domain-containing protein YiiM
MATGNEAHVLALFRPGPKGEAMERLDRVEVLENFGFKGDRKARPGSKRQVLIMASETIRDFGFQPGDLDENITTGGLAVDELPRGQRMRIGDVLLETTIERPACHKLDELRPGLSETTRHRRGMMAVVLQGGEIHVGDTIEMVSAEVSSQ